MDSNVRELEVLYGQQVRQGEGPMPEGDTSVDPGQGLEVSLRGGVPHGGVDQQIRLRCEPTLYFDSQIYRDVSKERSTQNGRTTSTRT